VYTLRDYQEESCAAFWQHLCWQAGNPVIVLPTGAGKSLVLAEIARKAVTEYKGRVMILAHRAELLQQNAEKVRALLPDCSVGIYSAGLRRFATDDDIVLAGIQSVAKKAELFGSRQLVLIDEVHLVPHDGEGRYRTFLDDLRRYNPKLRMGGLTATPYRTGEGSICRADGMFQRICYDASIQRLIEAGYLSRLTNQVASATVDTSGLHVRGGEFIAGEMATLFDDSAKVRAACQEIAAKTSDRKSVLIFCAGIGHAQHVAETLAAMVGEPVGTVTGNTSPLERSATLSSFRHRRLRYLTNVDVLTTGFDAPNIDAIAILRATQSPGLFAQICGRGFRIAEGKQDCLILDFGGNIQRHGPLDAIDFGKAKKGSFGGGEAPAKQCPNCEEDCPASVRLCENCGYKFPPPQLNHDEIADANSDLFAVPKTFVVEEVRFSRHVKKNKKNEDDPDTLRVDYLCKGEGNIDESISEWVCLEHSGFARTKAMLWWQARSKASLTADGVSMSVIDSAIDLYHRGAVAVSHHLTAKKDGHFWRILSHELDPIPETWSDEVAEEVFAGGDDDLPF
jgi:DNA repair protein RadD